MLNGLLADGTREMFDKFVWKSSEEIMPRTNTLDNIRGSQYAKCAQNSRQKVKTKMQNK